MAQTLERLQRQFEAARRLFDQASASGDTATAQRYQSTMDSLSAQIEQASAVQTPAPAPVGTSSPLVSDVPPPPAPTDPNQDFLTSISGKTFSDLTPEEMNRLLEIQSRTSSENLLDSYGEIIGGSRNQEQYYQNLIDQTRAQQERDFALKQAKIDEQLNALYKPQFSQIAQQGEAAREDLMRNKAFMGTARSSRTEEGRQELLAREAELAQAKLAEQSLDREVRLAELRGEDREVLKGLQASLDEARKNTQNLELSLIQDRARLEAELDTGAGQVLKQLTEGLLKNKSYDPELSAAIGQIVDSTGKAILGQDGKPLQFYQTLPGVDMEMSKMFGYLMDESGSPITNPETGEPIVIPPRMTGFTTVDGALMGVFDDGTARLLYQGAGSRGGGGAGGAGGSGADTTLDSYYDSLWQQVYAKREQLGDSSYGILDLLEEAGYDSKTSERLSKGAIEYLYRPAPEDAGGGGEDAATGGSPAYQPSFIDSLISTLSLSPEGGLFDYFSS